MPLNKFSRLVLHVIRMMKVTTSLCIAYRREKYGNIQLLTQMVYAKHVDFFAKRFFLKMFKINEECKHFIMNFGL